jgi:hypothetical protein
MNCHGRIKYLQPNANCYPFGISYTPVFLRVYVDKKTICTIPIVLILVTGIPTALAFDRLYVH